MFVDTLRGYQEARDVVASIHGPWGLATTASTWARLCERVPDEAARSRAIELAIADMRNEGYSFAIPETVEAVLSRVERATA